MFHIPRQLILRATFSVSKNIFLVSVFKETKVDSYFSAFEGFELAPRGLDTCYNVKYMEKPKRLCLYSQ